MKKALLMAIIVVAVLIATAILLPKDVPKDETVTTSTEISTTEPITEDLEEKTTKDTTTTKNATESKKTQEKTTEQKTETKQGRTSLGRFYVTGYTHEEGFSHGALTASGVGCRSGICAMNKSQMNDLGLKFGDEIYVDGLGSYLVQDTGCRYGVVDIWVWTNNEAYSLTGHYDVYLTKG